MNEYLTLAVTGGFAFASYVVWELRTLNGLSRTMAVDIATIRAQVDAEIKARHSPHQHESHSNVFRLRNE